MSDAVQLLKGKKIYWYQDDTYRDWGDLRLQVSIFDHHLSEEEAHSPLMFYKLARESGSETEYLEERTDGLHSIDSSPEKVPQSAELTAAVSSISGPRAGGSAR